MDCLDRRGSVRTSGGIGAFFTAKDLSKNNFGLFPGKRRPRLRSYFGTSPKGASAPFGGLAAETNAVIIGKYSGTPCAVFEVPADLQGLHRRIAQEGGWRGFLAQRILANGGLGFPEVNKPKDRVWFWTCAVGALIAITSAATPKWWAILAVIVAVVWGMPTLFTGPVALAIILWSGIVGGIVGGAVAILFPEEP